MKKALVLSGGGVKGAYEMGSYLAFKKCHIKFQGMAGTSIGAFNAAMLAAGKEKELYEIWKEANVGLILGFDSEYIKASNSKKDLQYFKMTVKRIGKIISSKGISIDGLKSLLEKYNIEPALRRSKIDFGLSTFRIKDFKQMDLFKEDIPKGRLNDYIIASCYFPIFRFEKIGDNNYYFDGGIINNCPVNMMIKKGFEKIYAVDLHAIGLNEKVDKKHLNKITYICPSHKLSATFTLNKKKVQNNIKLGYFDTMKVLNKYDGEKYVFKKRSNLYYMFIARKVPLDIINTLKVLLKTDSIKKIIIMSYEYMMKSEKMDYLEVYDINKLIQRFNNNKYHSIYAKFVRYIKGFK